MSHNKLHGRADASLGEAPDPSPHPLFDIAWYRHLNPDIPANKLTLEYYMSEGWRTLKSPHPLMSIEYYFQQNPDIKFAGMEPLTHFVTEGWKEGRNPHPLFDVKFYCSQISGFHLFKVDPLTHYVTIGWKQGLRPNKIFDPEWYVRSNADVKESGQEPLTHYLRVGWKDNRRPTPSFDPEAYRRCHGLSEETNPLLDYVLHGQQRILSSGASNMDVRHWQTNARLINPAELVLERPIGIFVHLFYDGVADEIASYLARIELPKKIYVTTDTVQTKVWIAETFDRYSVDAEIAVVPNCGFDIATLLLGFPKQLLEHDICLKIHGKKSVHNPPDFSIGWRQHLFGALIGDPGRVRAIVNAFLSDPELGVLIPQHWKELAGWLGIGANYEPMQRLLAKIGIDLVPGQDIQYPSGSMFWFRPEALSPLFELDLQWSDFSEPLDQRDCTLAHGVERCFLFFCAKANRKWAFLPEMLSAFELSRDETIRVIKGSGLFDEAYYRETYPDIAASGIDPVEHWVGYGFQEGKDPSPSFSTRYYNRVMRAPPYSNIDPLLHYILEGRAQGLSTKRPARVSASVVIGDIYEAYVRPETGQHYVGETKPVIRQSDVKLIAYYLPQYHPFAENDKFWGRGFTEWTNTTKAIPIFKGHYQPRLPGELGFYDTRLKQLLARQIELAKQYGIHGFCLHHYFFDGKPVMRAPYDLFLANPDLDIPFCLHWANEPWTVRFDGLTTKTGVLLDQKHSPEDDLAFFRDIEPALRDRRYILIDGRPVLIIYRPGLFPDIRATLERWRECCHQADLGNPYMVMTQTGFESEPHPGDYGFDAAIEFPPHNLGVPDVGHRLQLYDPGSEASIYDYEHTVDKALARPEPPYRQFRGIMPSWDCTPRRANPGVFINCAPHRYQRWLEGLCAKTANDAGRSPDEKLIFVNAWNEWAEGAYLEPDSKYGYAYLDATARALNNYRPASIDALNLRVLIAAHIFYLDLLDEFIAHFHRIPGRFDLLITTPIEKRGYVLQYVRERLGAVAREIKVLGVKNAGFDFGPFILGMLPEAQNYDVCCKIHSKKTPYNSKFSGWREFILGNLLGSPQNIAAIIEAFANDPKLGLVYPKVFPPVADHVEWGSNFEMAAALLQRLGITVTRDEQPVFPTGSMFWFRPKALRALLKLGLTLDNFVRSGEVPRVSESSPAMDGTLAHSLERMICYVAKAAGYGSREMLFGH
jgi:lipopolysaccharide biosynthesis protein